MTRLKSDTREQLLEKIIVLIKEKQPKKQATLLCAFIKQYFINVALEDLLSRDIEDLYGSLISHWNLIAQRKPGECNIHVYNPHFEQHGWQSTHTIIEVSHDDMPFLVDTLQMEIARLGFTIHLVIHLGGLKLRRDKNMKVTEVLNFETPSADNIYADAPIYFEIDRQTSPEVLKNLQENLARVLSDVRRVVNDYHPMREQVLEAITELKAHSDALDAQEFPETIDYLHWIVDNHFTFIGFRDYEVVDLEGETALKLIENTGLGVLRNETHSQLYRRFVDLPAEARELALSRQILILAKTNTLSTVHRPVYTDYIGIKRFNKKGEVIGERRFIGLYTSAAYNSNPKDIPLLRRKVAMVMDKSMHSKRGHAWKALVNILETLPRDDLFQSSPEDLLKMGMGILHMQERKLIRLFVREDLYRRFVSCLVYVPREDYNTELRFKIQQVLEQSFKPLDISFTTWFSDSVLARIHFLVRIKPCSETSYDVKEIEDKIIETCRSWKDLLKENLIDYYGEEKGTYYSNKYEDAFPASYREFYPSRTAVFDIEHIESISAERPLAMSFYKSLDESEDQIRFKAFREQSTIPLSDVLPILENLGLRVIGERPHRFDLKDNGQSVWLNDFSVVHGDNSSINVDSVSGLFQEAFSKTWSGATENDGFNRLVLAANITWKEITILRAYAKYMKQTGITFSQAYIEQALNNNAVIAKQLVEIFKLRFDPEHEKGAVVAITNLEAKVQKALDSVANLDEDRILRRYLDVIHATIRTNYFQKDAEGKEKSYLSFKFEPGKIPDLPKPVPMYEVFVYSPKFEGVHLRGGKVARGGLRWSDRLEDFRTEVLGLMKAQQVKNAVIVPSGAKGGFVCKLLPTEGTREAIQDEVVSCYQNFIRGLLDITDNLVEGDVVPPKNVVKYDEDDTYLVVAADKGTATFSDIANEISQEYGFWLGDAFASGGCTGYDHKKMGITARGAWESVKRHFLELGTDIQSTDFTVVGVGDMAGDVFGNGMLLSEHIQLVGAFNHMHIFIDPNPDSAASFKERKRLFALPRSSWSDYNKELISKGGGIFDRSAKSIKLTPEIKERFGLKQDFIVPVDLMRAMLKAPVDLLWNGGIGTFVKACSETHSDAGDRGNDAIRVNGNELQCKVVGEGGNLGLTQLARVEYALNGGIVNSDFIDNSAGVDCSDHEVNIKILLDTVVSNGDMTEKQRNNLLAKMTDEVSDLVLRHNYNQTLAISMAEVHAGESVDLFKRYICDLEQAGLIDRQLEFLPDEVTLNERKALGKGLTRPEIATLLAYTKNIIKEQIQNSELPEDPYLSEALDCAFPERLGTKYRAAMDAHSLRREIISTQLSNRMINYMGVTFVERLKEETGAPVSAIVRAYNVIQDVIGAHHIWHQVKELDHTISADTQLKILVAVNRLIRRLTRWILRNRRIEKDIQASIDYFSSGVKQLVPKLPTILVGEELDKYQSIQQALTEAGVPDDFASEIAATRAMFSIFDIIDAATSSGFALEEFATVYFALGEHLTLGWLRDLISNHQVEDHWDALARAALRDDLDSQQKKLTIGVLRLQDAGESVDERINTWKSKHSGLIERWEHLCSDLRGTPSVEYTMFAVALRELLDLAQVSVYNYSAPVADGNAAA